jgi:hypothetical protein
MRLTAIFGRGETVVLVLLGMAVLVAVTYGVVTYQTPYGCGDSNGIVQSLGGKLPSESGVDWQVLAEPCFYVYFTGIVGGSVLLIFLIPVPEKKPSLSTGATNVSPGNMSWRDNIIPRNSRRADPS